MPPTIRSIIAILGPLTAAAAVAHGGGATRAGRRYAQPPPWPPEVVNVFFEDATAALVGAPPSAMDGIAKTTPDAITAGGDDRATGKWSALISGEALEDEVKAIRIDLNGSLTNLDQFKAGGYRECRRDLGNLAVLLAVVARYDGPVRWKEAATQLWPRFARSAHNCSVGTDASYRDARARLSELDALVRGERFAAASDRRSVRAPFADFVERPLLMQRMERANQQRIASWLTSQRDFRQSREKFAHEGAILALLAEILQGPSMEYADDDAYAEAARRLRHAGLDMVAASRQNNYRAARQAAARATRTCNDCHDGYRE